MKKIDDIRSILQELIELKEPQKVIFYKTGIGQYSEHDKFMGIAVPNLRKISKKFSDLTFSEIEILLKSSFNEERLLALIILVEQYKKAQSKEEYYQFYLDNLAYVNNWNLVDSSAHLILGAYLFDKNKDILTKLAQSTIMWERRIAIIATWYFIKNNDLSWTFKIAEILLNDSHDLVHKASGWMLREAGKKNQAQLIEFLNKNSSYMPRTMLRYSIEKLSDSQRKDYLYSSKTNLIS